MENHEYSVYRVKVVQHKIHYQPHPGGEMIRTGEESDEAEERIIMAPTGEFGRKLVGIYFERHMPFSGVKAFEILSSTPIDVIVRYDDTYRGHV